MEEMILSSILVAGLIGGSGNDELYGGEGIDTADYVNDNSTLGTLSIGAVYNAHVVIDAFGDTDLLKDIERIKAGDHNVTISTSLIDGFSSFSDDTVYFVDGTLLEIDTNNSTNISLVTDYFASDNLFLASVTADTVNLNTMTTSVIADLTSNGLSLLANTSGPGQSNPGLPSTVTNSPSEFYLGNGDNIINVNSGGSQFGSGSGDDVINLSQSGKTYNYFGGDDIINTTSSGLTVKFDLGVDQYDLTFSEEGIRNRQFSYIDNGDGTVTSYLSSYDFDLEISVIGQGKLTLENQSISLSTTGNVTSNTALNAINEYSFVNGNRYSLDTSYDLNLSSSLGYLSATVYSETILLSNYSQTTAYASYGDDTVIGTSADEVIYGEVGNDILNGGSGNDTLRGGVGNDTLNGGDGDDIIYSSNSGSRWENEEEYQNSNISGGNGNDTIRGTMGNDIVHGGHGNDDINVYGGINTVYGDGGDDYIRANINTTELDSNPDATSLIYGGNGDDDIQITTKIIRSEGYGGNGNDKIYVFNGLIDGGDGNDIVEGAHYSNDYMVSEGTDLVLDTQNLNYESSEQIDRLIYTDSTILTDLKFVYINETYFNNGFGNYRSQYSVLVDNGNGSRVILDQQIFNIFRRDDLDTKIEEIVFSDGSTFDLTSMTRSDLYTYGTVSNDVIHAYQDLEYGNDVIYGEGGNDTLYAYGVADTLFGGDGNDILYGAQDSYLIGDSGDDTLYASDSGNVLRGGSGNDILYSGDGNDLMEGFRDNDTYYFTAGTDEIREFNGNDKVILSNINNLNDVQIYRTNNDLIVKEIGSSNLLRVDNFYQHSRYIIETLEFSDGSTFNLGEIDLSVYGTAGDDPLFGYLNTEIGDDNIYGYAGNDTIYARGGQDTVYGGDGIDFINGENGNDTLHGEAGDDEIYGSNGNDTIYGGAGLDDLEGGNGDDEIHGGDDTDFIAGREGNDTLHGDAGDDDLYGHNGDDTLYGGIGADKLVGGNDNDTLYGEDGRDSLYGDYGNDMIYAGADNDFVNAGFGDDIVHGGAGNDKLYGGYGNDTIYGDAGVDKLYANYDNDTLNGGDGIDYLYGGTGSDTFVFEGLSNFAGGTNYDRIYSFSMSQGDRLDVSDLISETTYVSGTDDLNDYLQLFEYGNDMFIRVDQDGVGTGGNVARLYNFNDWDSVTDVNTLVANGEIVV